MIETTGNKYFFHNVSFPYLYCIVVVFITDFVIIIIIIIILIIAIIIMIETTGTN